MRALGVDLGSKRIGIAVSDVTSTSSSLLRDADVAMYHAKAQGRGRTEHFTRARLATPMQPGIILDVTITGHDGRQLLAV